MPPRYVQLPNGSYLEWPEGISANEFKAKAAKVMGGTKPETGGSGNLWSGTESFSAYHPKTGLAGIEETLSNARDRLSEFAAKGVGQGAGDFMMSGPLGLLRVAKSPGDVLQGKPWQATKDLVGGGLEAATIPAGFIAPEKTAVSMPPMEADQAAKFLTDAVNPVPKHMAAYQKALGEHLDKILEFAKSKNLPLDSLDNFTKAIRETGDAIHQYYYDNVLGPVKDRIASIGGISGYSGKSNGAAATLKELDDRLTQINAELSPKYAKGGIAAQAAIKSTAELNAESAGIRKVLYGELAEHTGIPNEEIAKVRQSFGSLRDLAEKTEGSGAKIRHAVNARKQSPPTINPFSGDKGKQFVVDKLVEHVRGNPVDRTIRQVLSAVKSKGYELPNPEVIAETAKSRTAPIRTAGAGTEIGIQEPGAAERASITEKLGARRTANEIARRKADAERAQRGGEAAFRTAKHGLHKRELPYD